jgi:hypothetical protein
MTTDAPPVSCRGNPVGIASLVFGVLLLLAGIVSQALGPARHFYDELLSDSSSMISRRI